MSCHAFFKGSALRKIITNGAARISYLSDGEGPAVFVLPSLGRGPSDYDVVTRGLVNAGYRVIRPEPRGIGESTGPLEDITLRDLAGDVAAVADAEGLKSIVVAGHAFGNFVARMLAGMRPDIVRGVAMLAGSAGWIPGGESPYDEGVQTALRKSSDTALPVEERLAHLRTAFFARDSDPSVWLEGWNTKTKALQSRALHATPVKEWFGAGNAPILDLQADEDTVAQRKFAHVLKGELGDRVTVRVIERAGHALVPERPEAVVEHLLEWITTLDKRERVS